MSGSGYIVVGDVHGHLGALEALLRRVGCRLAAGGWVPPAGWKLVFVGDLVDRGPQQVEVVVRVREMVEAGHAHCVMGNHEYNAIGYFDGLRAHSPKNRRQHREFLAQVGEDSALRREIVDWFRTLPPLLDLGAIRVAHAWWSDPHAATVKARLHPDRQFADHDALREAHDRSRPFSAALHALMKGCEVDLPQGCSFRDYDGQEHQEIRVAWWRAAAGATYRDAAIVLDSERHRIPDLPLPAGILPGQPYDGPPVFVGHYCLQGRVRPMSDAVACVDWAPENGRGLVAYRWSGEARLRQDHFVVAA